MVENTDQNVKPAEKKSLTVQNNCLIHYLDPGPLFIVGTGPSIMARTQEEKMALQASTVTTNSSILEELDRDALICFCAFQLKKKQGFH
jgi:hypothetical protein